MYLNWPAGGDDREKQSFFWFHDHRMDHTGSNVYKGMVGLYPIYDPKPMPGTSGGFDMGDERQGLRLPGVRTNHADGSFDVDYDIPLAFYDCRLDDGVTVHKDIHDVDFPAANNPSTHPEWWGKTFYKHFPNHGFVGDIFTVNGTAYPVLEVKRRKYRFRFLDASIARIYDFQLMSSTQGPKTAVSLGYGGDELEGQYRIPDGQQCMKFTQIASDGGLLPVPIPRDNFELWPAKRREVIIDFTRYQDGTPTTKGDVIYLTNTMKMPNGRMWAASSRFSPDPNYKVPVLKFVIGDDAPDNSRIPKAMRPVPPLPSNWQTLMDNRLVFEVQRGSGAGEVEWLINGKSFEPATVATSLKNPAGNTPLAQQKKNSFNLWEIRNGGGGWVHPFHLHMEEHRTVLRNGKDVTKSSPGHPDDISREDLVALDPGEAVVDLPRLPRLHRPVRGALPQPGPRGPRHDVRLGDHLMSTDFAAVGVEERVRPAPAPAGVPWRTVLPLAVVLAFADTFWVVSLREAVGAIERTQTPFLSWVRESALSLPLFVLAVLGALTLAMHWFGPSPHRSKQVALTGLLVTASATLAGVAVLAASTFYDYRLEIDQNHRWGRCGSPAAAPAWQPRRRPPPAPDAVPRLWGTLILLVTNLVLVAWAIAALGGRLRIGRPRPAGSRNPVRDDTLRTLLVAGLVGGAVIHAAVVPEHLDRVVGRWLVLPAAHRRRARHCGMPPVRPPRAKVPALLAAAAASAGPLLLWLWSRSSGSALRPGTRRARGDRHGRHRRLRARGADAGARASCCSDGP